MSDCGLGITVPTFDGGLTISGVDMRTPAWCVLLLDGLWLEADTEGDDTALAGFDGRLAEAKTRTVTRHDLQLLVTGAVNQAGAPWPNEWIGLQKNLEYLHDNVLAPIFDGDGTRPSTLTMPDGGTRTARVHVTPRLDLAGFAGTDRVYTLTLSIPKGRFA